MIFTGITIAFLKQLRFGLGLMLSGIVVAVIIHAVNLVWTRVASPAIPM